MATNDMPTGAVPAWLKWVTAHLPESAIAFGATVGFFAVYEIKNGVIVGRSAPHDMVAIGIGAIAVCIGLALLFLRDRSSPQVAHVSGRLAGVGGAWEGIFWQPNLHGDISLTLKINKGFVTGNASLVFEKNGVPTHLDLLLRQGEVLYERFVQLDYREDDHRGVVQFGAIVVELSDGNEALEGQYVGYGRESRAIVGGVIGLRKKTPSKRRK
jgi:hypothetical protein